MKKNNKGFTLAELLIVVAIIAVLTAIAIPVFTTQLEKSREATDLANLRSAYAEMMTEVLTWDGSSTFGTKTVHAQQTQASWQNNGDAATTNIAGGIDGDEIAVTAKIKNNDWTVGVSYNTNSTSAQVSIS